MTDFTLREVSALGPGGAFGDPTDIRVRGGVIERVGPALPRDEHADIDLSGLWLMPGVFDCHVHVSASRLEAEELIRTSPTASALEAVQTLRRTLQAGVTFARDAGGAELAYRTAIEAGQIDGPRLQLSLVMLSQTGSHADMSSPRIADAMRLYDLVGVVDGVDEVRRRIRELLRDGADWIKLATTGGTVSPYDGPLDPSFTREEIEVAVSEAARRGRPVMSHAYGGEGLDLAVQAGVRSIEHGTYLTEEQAAAMARADCWLVPTLSVIHDVIDWADSGRLPNPAEVKKAQALRDVVGKCVEIAHAAGVRIATGTDFLDRTQHGRNLEEIAHLHAAGLPAAEALLAATRNGAQLCGVDDRFGAIAPGRALDAVVLGRDGSDPSVFRDPDVALEVLKGGRAVGRNPRWWADRVSGQPLPTGTGAA